MEQADPLLTSSDVARMFRVERKTVWYWQSTGKLVPEFKTLGRQARYRESYIRRLLAETQVSEFQVTDSKPE